MPFKIFTMREFVNAVPWSMIALLWTSTKHHIDTTFEKLVQQTGMKSSSTGRTSALHEMLRKQNNSDDESHDGDDERDFRHNRQSEASE